MRQPVTIDYRKSATRQLHKAMAAALAMSLSFGASSADLIQFQAGQPAIADDVNTNFTELEDRIDDVANRRSGTINVDCSTPSALNTALQDAWPGSEIVITGTCVGPTVIDQESITLRAATPGTDGIYSSNSDEPVLAVKGRDVTVTGIAIELANGTDQSYGLRVLKGGDAEVDNVSVALTGGGASLAASLGGTLTVKNITEIDHLVADDGGHILIEDGNGDFLITVKRSSFLMIESEAAGSSFKGIRVFEESILRTRWAMGSITLDDGIKVGRNATVRIPSPVVINSNGQDNTGRAAVIVFEGSLLHLRNAVVNGAAIVNRSSGLTACSTDFDDPTTQTPNDGEIGISLSSSLALSSCSSENNSIDPSNVGSIGVSSNSSAVIWDTAIIGHESTQGGWTDGLGVSTGDVTLERSTVDGPVDVDAVGKLLMNDSTVNGGLHASNNSYVALRDNAIVVAQRASNGTCPTSEDGIWVQSGAILHVQLSSSSITGYLEVDEADSLEFYGTFSNIDVLSDSPLAGESGINICNW